MPSNNKQKILQDTILSREGSIQAASMESFFGLNQTEITSQQKLYFTDSVVSLHSDGERMSKTNELKVCDFGFARHLHKRTSERMQSASNQSEV